MPDERVLEQLCALSGDDVAVVAAQVQAERARTPEGRSMWLMVAKRLSGAASTAILSVVFALVFVAGQVGPAHSATVQDVKTASVKSLYIVQSAILSVQVFLLVRLRRVQHCAALVRLSFFCAAL